MADSVVGRRPVFADELVQSLSRRVGLSLVGIASQGRPHFHGPSQRAFGSRPRREHILALRRVPRRLGTKAAG